MVLSTLVTGANGLTGSHTVKQLESLDSFDVSTLNKSTMGSLLLERNRINALANINKQNKYLPDSYTPILRSDKVPYIPLDFIIIFCWHIKREIINYLNQFLPYDPNYVTAIPTLEFL